VLSSHLFLLHAAHRRRCTPFVPALSLFRSANVTRPPRILQAKQNRVVAHASYLLSFKPLHTISSAPSTPKTSSGGRYNALDSIQLGTGASPPPVLLEARPSRPRRPHQSDSLPHTLTTRTTPNAALSLTPPRPQTAPCLRRTTPLRPAFLLKISPPSCRRSSPQTQCWNLELTSQRKHVRLRRRRRRLGIPGRSCIASGNVALWCEEFCLPIGMPGPVLQNLVISKPKVSLRILNDNHDHRPALT
jgi:hypothetical protein